MAGFIIFFLLLGLIIFCIKRFQEDVEADLEKEVSRMKAEEYDFDSDDEEEDEYEEDDDYEYIVQFWAGSGNGWCDTGFSTSSETGGQNMFESYMDRNPSVKCRLVEKRNGRVSSVLGNS